MRDAVREYRRSREIAHAVDLIWNSVRDVRDVAASVVDATSEIGAGSEQISSAMNEINESIGEITASMDRLGEEVGRFRIASGQ